MPAALVAYRGRAASFDLLLPAGGGGDAPAVGRRASEQCRRDAVQLLLRVHSGPAANAPTHADRHRAMSFANGGTLATRSQSPPRPLEPPSANGAKPPVPNAHDDYMARLSADIVDYYGKHKETEQQFDVKLQLRDRIAQIAQLVEPACRVFIIGSSMTRFGTNCSDLDICVMVSPQDHIDQWLEAMPLLYSLSRRFEAGSVSRSQTMIPAKVPILRASHFEPQHLYGDTTADINVNNAVALKNTHMLRYYAEWDGRVTPLVLLVKEWARRQGINDASRGTLSSYSLTLMVVHYLQSSCTPPVLPCLQLLYPNKFHWAVDPLTLDVSETLPDNDKWNQQRRNSESLGELLIGFLHYYAYEFKYDKDAVTVRFPSTMSRHQVVCGRSPYNRPSQWHCLCIEEPFTKANTAHSVYDPVLFDEVIQVFRASYKSLRKGEPLSTVLASGFCARFAAERSAAEPQGMRRLHPQHCHHRQPYMHAHNVHYPLTAAQQHFGPPSGGNTPKRNADKGGRWVETALRRQSLSAMRARHSIATWHRDDAPLPLQPPTHWWHPSGQPAYGPPQPQWVPHAALGAWANRGYAGRSQSNRSTTPGHISGQTTPSPPAAASAEQSPPPPLPVQQDDQEQQQRSAAAMCAVVGDSAVRETGPLAMQSADAASRADEGAKRHALTATATIASTVSGRRISVSELFGAPHGCGGGGGQSAKAASRPSERSAAAAERKKTSLRHPVCEHHRAIVLLSAPMEALMRSCAGNKSDDVHRTHSPTVPEEPTPPKSTELPVGAAEANQNE